MRLTLLTLAFGIFLNPANSQNLFEVVVGDSFIQVAESIVETPDKGFIITGSLEYTAIDPDLFAMKIDSLGNKEWYKTWGGSRQEVAEKILKLPDGNYMIVGSTRSFGAGHYDIWLIKIDVNGNEIWTKTVGASRPDFGNDFMVNPDGTMIISGVRQPGSGAKNNANIRKVDTGGTDIWHKHYGNGIEARSLSVTKALDGGYLLAGFLRYDSEPYVDAWILRTDSVGDTTWTVTFGSINSDYAYDALALSDSSFTVLTSETNDTGRNFVRLRNYSKTGSLNWMADIGVTDGDRGYDLHHNGSGGYFIVGSGFVGHEGERSLYYGNRRFGFNSQPALFRWFEPGSGE